MAELERILVQFSLLVAEQRWIKEIDVNPLVVSADQDLSRAQRKDLIQKEHVRFGHGIYD